jgi:uncharacterized RDD family membrane protein YckC
MEHRCRRCGRRLPQEAIRPSGGPYPASRGSVAPRLEQRQAISAEVVEAAVGGSPPPRQKTLFPEAVLRLPVHPAPPGTGPRQPARPGSTRRRVSRRYERLEEAGQQRLSFEPVQPMLAAEMKSGVRAARYCAEAVASPVRRLLATAIDSLAVAAALGLFSGVSYSMCGAAVIRSAPVPVAIAVVICILLIYKLFWWFAGADSPGMAACRLRLLNFTGQPPTRTQRVKRFAGTVLSLAAAGLGIAWILGDEEKLGWQDYISKTFPTPR